MDVVTYKSRKLVLNGISAYSCEAEFIDSVQKLDDLGKRLKKSRAGYLRVTCQCISSVTSG